MNKINEVIEQSNLEFEEDIVPIIKNPLLEYAHSEGYEKPKVCTKEDIDKIRSFISQRDQKILSAIEEERKERDGDIIGKIGALLLAKNSPQTILDAYFDAANEVLENNETNN